MEHSVRLRQQENGAEALHFIWFCRKQRPLSMPKLPTRTRGFPHKGSGNSREFQLRERPLQIKPRRPTTPGKRKQMEHFQANSHVKLQQDLFNQTSSALRLSVFLYSRIEFSIVHLKLKCKDIPFKVAILWGFSDLSNPFQRTSKLFNSQSMLLILAVLYKNLHKFLKASMSWTRSVYCNN